MSEEDKIAELLKPRIKMIAPMPKIFATLEVGQIWYGNNEDGKIIFNLTNAHRIDLEAARKYPHLFKKLEWWEDRKEDEMPEYIKFTQDYMDYKKGQVFKTCPDWGTDSNIYSMIHFIVDPNGKYGKAGVPASFNQLMPATKKEYNNQNNSK